MTWVDPRGPAAGVLHPGDVIEAANGAAMSTTDDWDVQTARLGASQTLVIGVRDSSGRRDVPVVAIRGAGKRSGLARPDAAAVAGNRRRSRSR